jgi:GTP pyrophosphokinase
MTLDGEPLLVEALDAAIRWHAGQVRKGTATPYVAHLLGTAAIVLDHGGDEDESVAALLHDCVEDTEATVDDVRAAFGERVGAIVAACSDAEGGRGVPKAPWLERKRAHLDHLQDADASVLLVTAADKLDNLRSTLADHRRLGDAIWERFNAGPEQQLWYYESVAELVRTGLGGSLSEELDAAAAQLRSIVGGET